MNMQPNSNQPQNQQSAQSANTIHQPPVVITTKDQLYLSDMLNWNLTAAKKAHFYAQHAMEADVKTKFEQVAQMHENHYNRLMPYLQIQGAKQ
ncbi:hypothetical protein [Geomicrobium sp. JCM 19038]|uniref:hypothetical protein n=1 Tax=Geomicrobium sp. JCM 19038 TaxID=1460635 RepID=UPI00045F4779|nr:hypothetical protein [Geomicrobium sp. JCM 19038]GAK08489.1 hypothetical protein JCM19038_2273 [Geomicrobium sp. JCM 19038]